MADNHSSSRNDSKANALINELSPYLLQHAYNPVEWMPWNDSTFEKAITEEKPVFVSIGYATCHWCHVMEHESFEDLEIAELLNRDFIAIKVDREERPDIDAALMEMCQAMTGHGGWPLTIFMTPEKLPFFAGTYFPKESIPNRIGFKDVLLRIAEGWKQERDAIISSGKEIVSQLSNHH
ncbi:MAG: thioredoxin domain-containing protein, partial [Candidatus Kapaibacteriota bacterium]